MSTLDRIVEEAEDAKHTNAVVCLWVVTVLLIVPLNLWRGFVFSKLWTWFVVPLTNWPAITPIVAAGLALALAIAKGWESTGEIRSMRRQKRMLAEVISNGITIPLFVLGTGWILTLFL